MAVARHFLVGLRPAALLLVLRASPAVAQNPDAAANARLPRFLYASPGQPVRVEIDARSAPALVRRVTMRLDDVTLRDALAAVAREGDLRLNYSKDIVPLESRVRLKADDITVAAALTELLLDAGVDVLVVTDRQIALVKRERPKLPPPKGTVRGKVIDARTRQPVARVTVSLDRSSRQAVADENGEYRLANVDSGVYTAIARRLGYTAQAKPLDVVGGERVLDFELEPAITQLATVVSTVTGQQERYKVGNAIATVDATPVMAEAPVTNITDLLNGRVPGLQVYSGGGLSGLSSTIRIRGTNSVSLNNDPIYVIDGVRAESSPLARTGLGSVNAGQRPGRLADLSPYEIETIDVVKGPSAATLYGSDAANGVIVIRTKRGTPGAAQWRFWGEQGTVAAVERFQPLYYAYGTNLRTGAVERCLLVQLAAGTCRQDSVVTWNPLEDDISSPLATGRRNVYGAQVRGGVQSFTYFLSGEKSAETGFLRLPDAEQARLKTERGVSSLPDWQIHPNWADVVNLRANIGAAIGNRAHAQLSNGLVINNSSIPSVAIFSSGGFASGSPPSVGGGWSAGRPGDWFSLKNADQTTRLTNSVAGDYQPADWLSTRGTVGLDLSSTIYQGLQLNGQGPSQTITGQVADNRFHITVGTIDLSATATFAPTARLTSRTSLGAQYNRRYEYDVTTTGTSLAPGATTLAGAAATTAGESTTETIVAGVYVEQAVDISRRFFVTGAVRLDGGSAFGNAFKTVAYPKASISWLAADGSRSRWIDNLRLRAAIGASGVQPSAVAALQRECLSSVLYNGVAVTGAQFCQLGNTHLKPETQTEIETGADAEFLGSRLNVELTLYNRQSRNAISNLTLPISVGGLSQPLNLGSVRNRGIEFALRGRPVDWSGTSLDLSLIGNFNENRLLKLGEGIAVTPTSFNRVGYPINSIFRYGYSYADADGNGLISPSEVVVDSVTVWKGATRPQQMFTGSVTLGLFRERVRLMALADYAAQYSLWDFGAVNGASTGSMRWTTDPTSPLDRQAATQAVLKNFSAQNGFIYDGRFLRVREVSAAMLPSSAARWARARDAQLSLSGRNVGLFLTRFPGFSVESPSTGASFDNGIGGNPTAPMPRYWLLRLTLGY